MAVLCVTHITVLVLLQSFHNIYFFPRFSLRVMCLKLSISATHGLLSPLFSPEYSYMTYYHIMLQIETLCKLLLDTI